MMTGPQSLPQAVDENLGVIAGFLAGLVGTIHLFHPQLGFPRLVTVLSAGDASLFVHDPRPVVFVLSAIAIWAGIGLVVWDVTRRPVYLLGMVLMASYFLGYFAWHLSGHGGFLPGRDPLYHGLTPIEAVLAHLSSEPVAALSKLAEATLFAVLAVLYRRDD